MTTVWFSLKIILVEYSRRSIKKGQRQYQIVNISGWSTFWCSYHNRFAQILTEKGVEFDILLLAGCLVIIVIGPGRISISYILKKVPRFLQ